MALAASGLLSVIVPTPSSISNFNVSYFMINSSKRLFILLKH